MKAIRRLFVVAALAASVFVGIGSATAQARAQINAYDAVLGPEYDVIFANARAYYNSAEVSFNTQVALAQAQIDAGNAIYGC